MQRAYSLDRDHDRHRALVGGAVQIATHGGRHQLQLRVNAAHREGDSADATSGAKVEFKEKAKLVFPEELTSRLDADPDFAAAFRALTPGRQRAYNFYFSAPEQSKTRAARVDKCVPSILEGRGLNDR